MDFAELEQKKKHTHCTTVRTVSSLGISTRNSVSSIIICNSLMSSSWLSTGVHRL